jgi:hypothetical protein
MEEQIENCERCGTRLIARAARVISRDNGEVILDQLVCKICEQIARALGLEIVIDFDV